MRKYGKLKRDAVVAGSERASDRVAVLAKIGERPRDTEVLEIPRAVRQVAWLALGVILLATAFESVLFTFHGM